MDTTTRSSVKREFKGIDITKFILALLVVAGHTHPFKDITNPTFLQIWNGILFLVVPYFFMAAGYFLFGKVFTKPDKDAQLAALWPYLKRIISLYVYWTIIFLPITIWRAATNDLSITQDLVLFIRGTFFFGENYFSWPLWFLLSMIYSIAFIYLLIYINLKIDAIFFISILVLIVAMIFNYSVEAETENKYVQALGKVVKYLFLTGRLFTGMFYLLMGGMIALGKIKLSRPSLALMAIIAIAFQFFKIDVFSALMFALLPVALFYITLTWHLDHVKNNAFLRRCSTVMYFTHMIVFFLYIIIFRQVPYFGWDAFLVAAAVPILLTPIIIRNEERLPILKHLFG